MNRADARREFRVGARPRRGRPLAPRIVAAGGDGQHPAHRGNCVHGLIRVHELERRDGTEPVSVANQAAAFDSISRSSRSTRFSRRKRLSSSRSAVVSPSRRRPSSSPACLTHLRIALAEASNSRANCAIGRPVRANSMIRRRYSGAYGGWVLGIGDLLLPFSPTPSTKAGQLHGFASGLWTASRMRALIEHETGVRYHEDHVWRILRKLNWSCQRPTGKALERDEQAIRQWQKATWPRIKKKPAASGVRSSLSTKAE